MIRWVLGAGEKTPLHVDSAVNLGYCDCVELLFVKPPDILGPALNRLENVAQLLDSARGQLRALRGESEPHNNLVLPGVDEDILDRYVLCLALDCILES